MRCRILYANLLETIHAACMNVFHMLPRKDILLRKHYQNIFDKGHLSRILTAFNKSREIIVAHSC